MPDASPNLERETRILDAAEELIAHYGYSKTTVDDIAAKAGISKGAVYLHFRSKDELLDRLIERIAEQLMDDLMTRLDNDPNGVTLFNIYRHSMIAVSANPLARALYIRDRRILGDYLRKMTQTPLFQQSMMFGTEFIVHFQKAGLIRQDVNPETLAYILMSLRYGVLNIEEFAPETATPSIEEIGELIGDMLHKSFGTESGDSEAGRQAMYVLLERGRELLQQMRATKSIPSNS